MLIERGADVNARAGGEHKHTPLLWAAQKGYKYIAEILIAKGADVNARAGSKHTNTPLLWAAERGYK